MVMVLSSNLPKAPPDSNGIYASNRKIASPAVSEINHGEIYVACQSTLVEIQ
jgi:hypothetical protein